jgi:hypothetical protein
MTCYGLEDLNSVPRRGRDFFLCFHVQNGYGIQKFPIHHVPSGKFPRLNLSTPEEQFVLGKYASNSDDLHIWSLL